MIQCSTKALFVQSSTFSSSKKKWYFKLKILYISILWRHSEKVNCIYNAETLFYITQKPHLLAFFKENISIFLMKNSFNEENMWTILCYFLFLTLISAAFKNEAVLKSITKSYSSTIYKRNYWIFITDVDSKFTPFHVNLKVQWTTWNMHKMPNHFSYDITQLNIMNATMHI